MRRRHLLVAVVLLAAAMLLWMRRAPPPAPPGPVRTWTSPSSLMLAYPGRQGGWVQVCRDVGRLPSTSEEKALRMVRELSRPETNPAVFPPLPDPFPVRSVYRDGAKLYLDISVDALRELSGGSEEEILLLEGLRQTLAWNLPDISELQILVDGQPRRTLGVAGDDGGHINIFQPLRLR